jgi:hypothetical protein
MNQERLNRFYKEVDHIQSLNKNEIDGNLADHFKLIEADSRELLWLKQPPLKVKNAVLDAAYKFLDKF